jgi:hypothetical protein
LNVYLFSSKNLTNIWAGIGAGLWAVSTQAAQQPPVRAGAQDFPAGALGLFYCTEIKSLTTPFMVLSRPDLRRVVDNVWPERWALPFSIYPIGSPHNVFEMSAAKNTLPAVKKNPSRWASILHIQPMTAFRPSRLQDEDWEIIVNRLATR